MSRTETSKVDDKALWTYRLPEVAATELQLSEAEAALGWPIDLRYREFLRHANGWHCFYQRVDLFGTRQLCGACPMEQGRQALDAIDDESLASSKLARVDLTPIGFSEEQSDLFLICKSDTTHYAAVVWMAGYEIERFATFDDFFLAMVDYNRLRLDRLRGNPTAGT